MVVVVCSRRSRTSSCRNSRSSNNSSSCSCSCSSSSSRSSSCSSSRGSSSDIYVDPYRLWFEENLKSLVRLQDKIMGLESCNTRATATLSTRRPFNDNAGESACHCGAVSMLMKHGWAPQEKVMGLAGVMFACLTENTPPLKRGRSISVSVASHCGICS